LETKTRFTLSWPTIYMHIVAKHTAMSVNVLCNFSVFICVIAAASLP